jgi:hypothetical protein
VIPACRDQQASGNLPFNQRSGHAVQTDGARQVHLVANSGRQQEICALKIWREGMSLDFPSLYLESCVLHARASERFGQLADNVLTVLTVLRYLSPSLRASRRPRPRQRGQYYSLGRSLGQR